MMVDQKRLIVAIAISIAILFVFEMLWNQPLREAERARQAELAAQAEREAPRPPAMPGEAPAALGTPVPGASAAPMPATTPASLRVRIDSPDVVGSINLVGAAIDDVTLRRFGVTPDRDSERVRVFSPRGAPNAYFAQFGWSAVGSEVKVPAPDTVWQTSATVLGPGRPVTLFWDNGEGQRFEIAIGIDEHFLFTVEQRVINGAAATVAVNPWGRIRREYTPETAGFFILHEGLVGVFDGRLTEQTYKAARDEAEKQGGVAFTRTGRGGWAGFSDKYWLGALIPDQAQTTTHTWRVPQENGTPRYQIDFLAGEKQIGPGLRETVRSYLFAGAKEVALLDRYAAQLRVEGLDKAIDWGWFYFLTRPFFWALHWLGELFGNYGVAILIFTLFLKGLFFPLANKSYKAMSKMKLLAPKMQELKEKHKDDPSKLQQEMMALYRREKVNPVSGCLPIVLQIPVFFALYKVLFVTIEMRHAPFFGWIRDLSAPDPTNIFTLFGLIPWDPTVIPIFGHFLHLGVWPLIMGATMYFQQKLNPTPPDPVQQKVFMLMPFVFTFMLASFPSGLVIYWSWNNLLSIAQQWLIMRRVAQQQPAPAKT
jgi:YidC/Oxa1 family membrane protein insertase